MKACPWCGKDLEENRRWRWCETCGKGMDGKRWITLNRSENGMTWVDVPDGTLVVRETKDES